MSKSSHTHTSFQPFRKNTAGKSATHHLIDVNILFAHLGPIAPLADKGAAATRSFREHDPVGMLRCSLHKLLDNMVVMMMVTMRNAFVEYDR